MSEKNIWQVLRENVYEINAKPISNYLIPDDFIGILVLTGLNKEHGEFVLITDNIPEKFIITGYAYHGPTDHNFILQLSENGESIFFHMIGKADVGMTPHRENIRYNHIFDAETTIYVSAKQDDDSQGSIYIWLFCQSVII